MHNRLIIMLATVLLLQACHHQSTLKPINPNRLVDLTEVGNFQFSGSMSFSDDQDGGSGRFQWENKSGLISVQLKAPMGIKSWRIIEQTVGAELITKGSVVYADNAQTLISNQLGWQVPWQQLKSWVIGQPYNKSHGQIFWHSEGFTLSEDGWQIEYSRLKPYPDTSSQQLPHKMVARKDTYSIKLSIKQWTW